MNKQPLWVEAKLGDLGRFSTSSVDKKEITGQQYVRLINYMDVYNTNTIDGNIDFMKVTASQMEVVRSQVEIGDILFTPSSETPDDIGHSAVVSEKLEHTLHSYHTVRFRPNLDQDLDLRFKAWFANSANVQMQFSKKCSGSTRYTLTIPAFESIKFKYPKSLVAQKKIATYLDTINLTIEKTEALIEKYKQIKAGLMHDLFTRGITADGKLRPPREQAPELYQETPIGWIPKDWNHDLLENLLAPISNNFRSGPFGSALLKSELVDNGIPFLGIDNIHKEKFVAKYRRFVSDKKYNELIKYAVRPKDVVITIMGTVGRCSVIPDKISKALSSKHLWAMTLNRDVVIPELICWQLNYASWVKAWFRRETQGGIMDAIQSKTLKTLRLPMPTLVEQNRIFERYKAVSSKIETELKNLEKLNAQKSGLMHDLLTGKVEVKLGEQEIVHG